MFFYIAKIFANHFACGRRQLPLILQKRTANFIIFAGDKHGGAWKSNWRGAHTHTHTNNLYNIYQSIASLKDNSLLSPRLYISTLYAIGHLPPSLPVISFCIQPAIWCGVPIAVMPRALSLKTIKIHIVCMVLVRRRCMFYYCMFVSSPVGAAFVCCAGWSVLCGAHTFPDTVVVKLKSVENIFLFSYTQVSCRLCALLCCLQQRRRCYSSVCRRFR